MIRRLLVNPFVWLAAVGFAGSLFLHLAAVGGWVLVDLTWALLLTSGCVVLWGAALLFTGGIGGAPFRPAAWRMALRGAAGWLKVAAAFAVGYLVVSGALFAWAAPGTVGLTAGDGSGQGLAPALVRFFSAAWLAAYAVAWALLDSYRRAGPPRALRCPKGHRVSALAKFCDRCGAPMDGGQG
ncbi:MAG: hypothetical protein HY719_05560, partial [Planctomycetes bacterium]|nr:hypothetical protein [Planctomycetota bacterium]